MRNNRDLPLSPRDTQHTRFRMYPSFSVHFAHVGYLTDWVWTWKLGQLQISYSFQYNCKYPTLVNSRRNLNINFLLFRNRFYEEKTDIRFGMFWSYSIKNTFGLWPQRNFILPIPYFDMLICRHFLDSAHFLSFAN